MTVSQKRALNTKHRSSKGLQIFSLKQMVAHTKRGKREKGKVCGELVVSHQPTMTDPTTKKQCKARCIFRCRSLSGIFLNRRLRVECERIQTGNYFGQGTISDRKLFQTGNYFFWDTSPPSTLVNFDRAVERQHHDPVGHPWGSCACYLRNSFKW